MEEPEYHHGFKKESAIEHEIRVKRRKLEKMLFFMRFPEDQMEWSVSNLMKLNKELPINHRGKAKMEETKKFIVELLRNRRKLNIP